MDLLQNQQWAQLTKKLYSLTNDPLHKVLSSGNTKLLNIDLKKKRKLILITRDGEFETGLGALFIFFWS